MGFLSVLSMAHKLAGERLQPGDAAVDATAGTGADTLFWPSLRTEGAGVRLRYSTAGLKPDPGAA
ncbi:hypothetical protein HMSSN036_29530 [Paenibacillus macerans]|nr:hypothetical protein HMSSN036_29530 [Paenibacillus macerans]